MKNKITNNQKKIMDEVLTAAKYRKICRKISRIESQPQLQFYLDSIDAAYSKKNKLFWLQLLTELSKHDEYDCLHDADLFWKNCTEEVPQLQYYFTAENPSIRYAKVYSCYKEEEQDLRSVIKSKKNKERRMNGKLVDHTLVSNTFYSDLSETDQKKMYQLLIEDRCIANTSEETFMMAFSKIPTKELKGKISWAPSKRKHINETLFMLLHKMSAGEYSSLPTKKEYFFKILSCFDLSVGNMRKNPSALALKSSYHKWVKKVFKKYKVQPDLLDDKSYAIFGFQATSIKRLAGSL